MYIRQEKFGGSIPRVAENLLPSNMARVAQNCDLLSGNLRSLRDTEDIWTPTKAGPIKSIFLFNDTSWFHWPEDVHVVKSPLAADTQKRVYFTGTDVPRFTDATMATMGGGTDYPIGSIPLAIPVPGAPSAVLTGQTTGTFKSKVWSGIAQDTSPDPFVFASKINTRYGASLGAMGFDILRMYSEEVIITGLNSTADISVVRTSVDGYYPTFFINGKENVTTIGKVANGDRLVICNLCKHTAGLVTTTNVTVGGYLTTFTTVISAGVIDIAPDVFGGESKTNQPIDAWIYFPPFTVSGLDTYSGVAISIVGGEAAVGSTQFTYPAGTVTYGPVGNVSTPGLFTTDFGSLFTCGNGDVVHVRVKSSAAYDAETVATLIIGGIPGTFTTRTCLPNEEAQFATPPTFEPLLNVQPSAFAISQPFVVSGLDFPTPIRIEVGEYSINLSPFTTEPGMVTNGDIIHVKHTSGVEYNEEVESLVVIGGATGNFAELSDRFYLATFARTINGITEEGAPGDISSIVSAFLDQEATLDLSACQPAAGNPASLTHVRIYRSLSGELYRVGEVEVGETLFSDTVTGSDLPVQPLLVSENWLSPPNDLRNLLLLPNGAAAGISGKEVLISVPYQLHAWPLAQRYAYVEEPAAIGAFGSSIVVLLPGGRPQLLTGSDPAAMGPDFFELKQTCESTRSVAVSGGIVMFAAPDGIAGVGPGFADLLSRPLIDRETWRLFNPSSILGVVHDGRYYGFWDNGVTRGGFVVDPDNELAPWQTLDLHATAAWSDETTDSLYLVVDGEIIRWNTGAGRLTYQWEAKEYILPSPVNMVCAKVEAVDYDDITLRVYAGATLKHEQPILDGEPFWLAGEEKNNRYRLALEGTSEVQSVAIAETMEEIQKI